jgi:hypothetical protein
VFSVLSTAAEAVFAFSTRGEGELGWKEWVSGVIGPSLSPFVNLHQDGPWPMQTVLSLEQLPSLASIFGRQKVTSLQDRRRRFLSGYQCTEASLYGMPSTFGIGRGSAQLSLLLARSCMCPTVPL